MSIRLKRGVVVLVATSVIAAGMPTVGISSTWASDPTALAQSTPNENGSSLPVLPESVTGFDVENDEPIPSTPTSISIAANASGQVSGEVSDQDGEPSAGVVVTIVATSSGEPTESASVTTDSAGKFSHSFDVVGGRWNFRASVAEISSTAIATVGSRLELKVSVPSVKTESTTTLRAHLTDRGKKAGGTARVEVLESGESNFRRLTVQNFSSENGLNFKVRPWRNPTYRVTAIRNEMVISKIVQARTKTWFTQIVPPRGMREPKNRTPLVMRPVGAGSNTVVRRIPSATWKSMKGKSWRRGCASRSRLSLIETNYRGFDGYRHRGQIVVAKAIGSKMKRAFQRLYKAKFPIRQIRLVDAFGRNVNGHPGANDYRSMAADNTSAFNCRYVVGREKSRVRSPHASGRSVDINPWENPYVVGRNSFPNRHYLNRKVKHPGIFKRASKATKILRGVGCRWGGSFRDYHHWDC